VIGWGRGENGSWEGKQRRQGNAKLSGETFFFSQLLFFPVSLENMYMTEEVPEDTAQALCLLSHSLYLSPGLRVGSLAWECCGSNAFGGLHVAHPGCRATRLSWSQPKPLSSL
jgi:hypothetical protein